MLVSGHVRIDTEPVRENVTRRKLTPRGTKA
jgi:hypothetical protein